MGDYRRLLGDAALGLGLGQSPDLKQEDVAEVMLGFGLEFGSRAAAKAVVEYRRNPTEAFNHAAKLYSPPGESIPVPFATVIEPHQAD